MFHTNTCELLALPPRIIDLSLLRMTRNQYTIKRFYGRLNVTSTEKIIISVNVVLKYNFRIFLISWKRHGNETCPTDTYSHV